MDRPREAQGDENRPCDAKALGPANGKRAQLCGGWVGITFLMLAMESRAS